jgi:murein DD-endopeptidase MepM/ murein hydrolase activator NlpD
VGGSAQAFTRLGKASLLVKLCSIVLNQIGPSVQDLGRGVFAFYAHLKKGSVRVTIGQRVRRGEVVANLGNTGNTSAPHLHFHLMDNPSVLGSSGLPYVIDRFTLSGRISAGDFKAAEGLEGIWSKSLSVKGSPRQKEFPVDGAIVDFAPVDSGLHHQSSQ